MPVDPNIYATLNPGKGLSTLADFATIRDQREDRAAIRAERESLTAQRRAATTKAQKDAERDALIQATFRKHNGPNGLDQKALLADLYSVDHDAATKAQTALIDYRKKAADAETAEWDADSKRVKRLSEMLQGVEDDDTYQLILPAIQAYDQKYGDQEDGPGIAETLGPTFDPKKVAAVVSAGMSHADYNTKKKEIVLSTDKDIAKVLNLIALADDPKEYADALAFAKLHAVDDDVMAMGFTPEFAAGHKQRAADMTMDPEKRATLAGAQEGRDLTRRGQNMSAATAAAGQAVTMRGQDITAGSAANRLAFDKVEAGKPGAAAKAGPNVGGIIDQIDSLSKRINTGAGGVQSVISGYLRGGLSKAQMDNDVSEYNALVEGMIPMVARSVGHTGVLTQQDVDSVRAMFPKVGDNKTLAENKLKRVKSLIGGAAPSAKGGGDPLGIR